MDAPGRGRGSSSTRMQRTTVDRWLDRTWFTLSQPCSEGDLKACWEGGSSTTLCHREHHHSRVLRLYPKPWAG
ncbi:hypothetical protein SKAU_G00028490 [Synaphobranchus kaupii]|uniref:Uncharacterized protein n=1 Tax=Synaphobranchus kaupii TaxID=118154 RepID=A0A9Q1GEH5_SYNKA|nr:hypothetical protein SKAU_G00028490 [Synaphobranchus kaupii]